MTDVPTSAARTLIDVEQVGMFLFSHLRCRFQVLQLFMGRFLAPKDEFATPGAVRSAVTPKRPPLRQTLYVPFSHLGMLSLPMLHLPKTLDVADPILGIGSPYETME